VADKIRSVAWSETATAALDEALTYVAASSPQAAGRLLEQALHAAERLSTLSHRGRMVPELEDSSIREVFVGRYRLLYRVEEDQVVVLTFLHGARDFSLWRQTQTEL
jgi:plasmid stabilization system protein ParE